MKEILVTYLLGYIIIFASCAIYSLLGFNNLDYFINGPCVYIIICFYILTSIYLYYKNKRNEELINYNGLFSCGYFGISFAILFNMIIFYFFPSNNDSNVPLYLAFVSSGIVGPIYEEILFRYILFQRLKKRMSIRLSVIVSSLIFGIIHMDVVSSIYAFVFGLFLASIYEKKKHIIVPILIHIFANSVVLFLSGFNPILFILALINFVISCYLILL